MSFYEPILYVAECGSNHCGSLERAQELVMAAKEAGAGAVKFQLFTAAKMYDPTKRGYKTKVGRLEKWELRPQWIPTLSKLAREAGMQFICSVFDPEDVEVLRGEVDQVKISAYDLTYHKLVGEACELGMPIILSTAMATPQEIDDALDAAGAILLERTTLLHGVAQYPVFSTHYSPEILCYLQSTGCKVGISDHTTGVIIASFATHPITMIERHFRQFTTPKESPDYEVSSDPKMFRSFIAMVERVRKDAIERLEGGPLPCEMDLYKTCRRTDENPYRK